MEKYIRWLIPVQYEFYFIIDDLSDYESKDFSGVYNIPFKKQDAATIIKFHIKGVELPDNDNEIDLTF